MNLELMISKYLDGELNQEEDIQLRKLISEDNSVREMFDTAVHIHLALKEDAESIRPSKTLINDTEDRVLMKILSSQPVSTDTVYKKQRSYALATLVFLFLIAGVFKINDSSLLQVSFSGNSTNNPSQDNIASNTAIQSGTNEVSLDKRSSTAAVGSDAGSASNRTFNASNDIQPAPAVNLNSTEENLIASDMSADISDNNVSKPILAEGNKQAGIETEDNGSKTVRSINTEISSVSISESIASDKIAAEETPGSHMLQRTMISSGMPLDQVNAMNSDMFPYGKLDFQINTDQIQISSFLGTDFARIGINSNTESPITHISQSIAYSLSNNDRIGIEFGYTQYEVMESIKITVPLGTDGTISSARKEARVQKLEKLNPNGNNYVEVPYSFARNQQIFWGAAFYERELIDFYDLSLNGRLGAGATADGMLGYGRVFGKYRLFSGFSLTLGTEGRIFSASIPKISNTDGNKFKSSFSLIYGFQLKF